MKTKLTIAALGFVLGAATGTTVALSVRDTGATVVMQADCHAPGDCGYGDNGNNGDH